MLAPAGHLQHGGLRACVRACATIASNLFVRARVCACVRVCACQHEALSPEPHHRAWTLISHPTPPLHPSSPAPPPQAPPPPGARAPAGSHLRPVGKLRSTNCSNCPTTSFSARIQATYDGHTHTVRWVRAGARVRGCVGGCGGMCGGMCGGLGVEGSERGMCRLLLLPPPPPPKGGATHAASPAPRPCRATP